VLDWIGESVTVHTLGRRITGIDTTVRDADTRLRRCAGWSKPQSSFRSVGREAFTAKLWVWSESHRQDSKILVEEEFYRDDATDATKIEIRKRIRA
jgi:hypothetical protein